MHADHGHSDCAPRCVVPRHAGGSRPTAERAACCLSFPATCHYWHFGSPCATKSLRNSGGAGVCSSPGCACTYCSVTHTNHHPKQGKATGHVAKLLAQEAGVHIHAY